MTDTIPLYTWLMGAAWTLFGAVVSGLYVWHNAPQVGGEWWPYVRVVAAVIAAIIGGKVAALAAAIVVVLALASYAVLVTAR